MFDSHFEKWFTERSAVRGLGVQTVQGGYFSADKVFLLLLVKGFKGSQGDAGRKGRQEHAP